MTSTQNEIALMLLEGLVLVAAYYLQRHISLRMRSASQPYRTELRVVRVTMGVFAVLMVVNLLMLLSKG